MQSRVIEPESTGEQRSSEFVVRPLRLGYIVNRNVEQSELRRVYQYNTSHWGGKYNIFVPTDGEYIRTDWLRQLVMHDPDILLFVGTINQQVMEIVDNLLQPLQKFIWDVQSLEALTGVPTQVNALLMDVILEKLVAETDPTTLETSSRRYIETRGEFAPYIESISGLWLPESNYRTFAEQKIGAVTLPLEPNSLDSYLAALDQIDQIITPLQLTRYRLRASFQLLGSMGYSLVITTGLIDDIFIQYALNWLEKNFSGRKTHAIIPLSALSTDNDYKTLAAWFSEKVGGNHFDLISYSVDIETLTEIRSKLKEYLPVRKSPQSEKTGWLINIHQCNVIPPIPTLVNDKRIQNINVLGNRYSFELPQPSFMSNVYNNQYQYKRWACDIDLSPSYRSRNGFLPSVFPDLNFLLSNLPDRRFLSMNRLRIARGCLTIATSMKDNVETILLPEDKKLIETACENAGFELKKGNSIYYQGMINLTGDLENAKFLHDPNIFNLFSCPKMIQGHSLTINEMLEQLKIPKGDWDTYLKWIQLLASKQILLRGYLLQCPVCGLKAWYELARVGEHMRCEGCRAHFQIPVKMDFAYRLNRLFADRNNQGTTTVLLTLLLLHETSLKDLIWQADVKLKSDLDGKETELDIIAMCDGYLVVAECKNKFLPRKKPDESEDDYSRRKEEAIEKLKDQLEREIQVAKDLGAHLFLFATLEEEIPSVVTDLIKDHNDNSERMGIRILLRSELIGGKFQHSGKKDRHISMYDVAGEYIYPPFYEDIDCSNKDENWPSGSFSLL